VGYYGDYYGDYYRGDPGFLGNLFRGIGRTVGGAVTGFITGGPKGAIGGAIGGAVSATRKNVRATTLEAGGSSSAYTPALRAQHAQVLARGPVASSALLSSRTSGGARQAFGGQMIGEGRRRRRMNWANGRALGRAERRIHAAVKHMARYIKWVHPKKEGHAAPKFGKKKRAA